MKSILVIVCIVMSAMTFSNEKSNNIIVSESKQVMKLQVMTQNDTIKELTAKLRELKNPNSFIKSVKNHCDDDDDSRTTCVPQCNVRYSDGSCGSYGSDFCAPDASCSPQCNVRYSDGSCGSYGSDFCGSNASCSENCNVRYSDGSCGSYGSDICY